ncbi:MAG: HEAT repeat domain-containing protein [Planctomycetota bacterium]
MRSVRPDAPEVRALVLELGEGERAYTWMGWPDQQPAAMAQLVAMGPRAVPALLHHAKSSPDRWTRVLLIDVLGRIGDRRALPFVRGRLHDADADVRSVADAALLQLLPDAELLALQKGPQRLEILAERVRRGDLQAIDELLRIATPGSATFGTIVDAVLLHAPLRQALGFGPDEMALVLDDEGFLLAAREWYIEHVRGERSPWKPDPARDAAALATPAGMHAYAALAETADAFDWMGSLRVIPKQVSPSAPRAMTAVLAYGHGSTVLFDSIRRAPDGWVVDRVVATVPRFDATFASQPPSHRHYSAPIADEPYRRLRHALEAILAADVRAWWSGPHAGLATSSGNYTFAIAGLAEELQWQGYPSSERRAALVRIEAAKDHYLDTLPPLQEASMVRHEVLDPVLLDVWHQHAPTIGRPRSYGYLQRRLLAATASIGTPAMAEPLRGWFATKAAPSAADAALCNAYAACSGLDLRFDPDGTPRSAIDTFTAYRTHLR